MTAPGMRARVASIANPVTRRRYFPNLLIFDSPCLSRLKLEFVSLGQPGPNIRLPTYQDLRKARRPQPTRSHSEMASREDVRSRWATWVGAVKRQSAELEPCRRMPCFAATRAGG